MVFARACASSVLVFTTKQLRVATCNLPRGCAKLCAVGRLTKCDFVSVMFCVQCSVKTLREGVLPRALKIGLHHQCRAHECLSSMAQCIAVRSIQMYCHSLCEPPCQGCEKNIFNFSSLSGSSIAGG